MNWKRVEAGTYTAGSGELSASIVLVNSKWRYFPKGQRREPQGIQNASGCKACGATREP